MIPRAIQFSRVAMAVTCIAACVAETSTFAAASTTAYGIIKQQNYAQTSANAPDLQSVQPFIFSAFAIAAGSNTLSSVALQVGSGGTPFALTRDTNSGSFFFVDRFDTQPDLDSAYPSGPSYKMTITGTDNTHQPSLNFGADQYPSAPRLTNFAATQVITASSTFTFEWDSLPGGTTNDIVQLIITDDQTNVVYTSPGIGATNGLDGTSNSVTIAANTLEAGRNYNGTLFFGKVLPSSIANQFIYPGVRDIVGYARLTSFDLHTAAGSPPYSRLEVLTNNAAGAALRFTTSTGFVYRLETSTNLTGWSTLLATNPVTTNVVYIDSSAAGLPKKFYRLSSP